MDSEDNPTVNEILDKDKMTSISKPSYLDMPMVKSIASVYQTKRLKYAMQFHHAAFNTYAKSTLLMASIRGILPIWPLLTREKKIKICNGNPGKTHGTHAENTPKSAVNKKRVTTIPAKP